MIALLKIDVFRQVSKSNKNGEQKHVDRLKPFTPILKHSLIDLFDVFEAIDGVMVHLNHVGFTSGVLNPLVV